MIGLNKRVTLTRPLAINAYGAKVDSFPVVIPKDSIGLLIKHNVPLGLSVVAFDSFWDVWAPTADLQEITYEPKTMRLVAGYMRRLYVNRNAAKDLEPPITVEMSQLYGTLSSINAREVVWNNTKFKWSGNNTSSPALWIETDAELVLTL